MAFFNLDIKPNQERAAELGIQHVRFIIQDFNGSDLRKKLPEVSISLSIPLKNNSFSVIDFIA